MKKEQKCTMKKEQKWAMKICEGVSKLIGTPSLMWDQQDSN